MMPALPGGGALLASLLLLLLARGPAHAAADHSGGGKPAHCGATLGGRAFDLSAYAREGKVLTYDKGYRYAFKVCDELVLSAPCNSMPPARRDSAEHF